jgi:hypothetical protein
VISFRFHLVSLVAVFMALGLGVLTGTTVINRGIVTQLENQTEGLSRNLDEVRSSVDRLEQEVDVWSGFGEEARAPLVSGRLLGRQVVMVTQEGTDGGTIAGVRRALEEAGADLVAQLSVGGRMSLPNEADRQALARAVEVDPALEPDLIVDEAARDLATRLAEGPGGRQILEALLEEGFLAVQGPRLEETGLRSLGGPGQLVVALAGGPAPSDLLPEDFLVPMIEVLVAREMPVVACEPVTGEEEEPPFVTTLRREPEVAGRISTQDNVDLLPGQIGLVVAVEDLFLGAAGHYGVKDGATRPLPELG